jgi:PEP-CTERM motif
MKKVSLITIASVAAAAAVLWSVPAAAQVERVAHDLKPYFGEDALQNSNTGDPSTPTTGVPEPGMLVLLTLGLGSLGFVALRRRRVRA